ncbi:acetate kinase [Paraflavitalea soli]|uniref:Acetate kinase n=1 Tax=Paraflavitalea soli TaxID=2315862 RepID=A0A3B7MHF9_9BACT|nr:acetate kinase [Paraflavitalea soli]AXY72589.1 acetate kinase [Paraflavitalea soli]
MKVLVINAGSSSLKFRLFDMPGEQVLCSGIAERIGEAEASIHITRSVNGKDQTTEQQHALPDHAAAMQQVVSLLCHPEQGVIQSPEEVALVGHRVVHGGESFSSATIVTPAVREKIKELFPFAPLHNPINLRCLEVAADFFPAAKQVAVFDTAFHHELPPEAARYAIPHAYYEQDKIRAYGFHGISHKYVTEQARDFLDLPQAKMISLHLGNGCSAAAVEGARSLDTSMGFSPVSGLVMGTRSGDIDPSVLLHLMTHHGYSTAYVDQLLNKRSGLQGLTGRHDMRDIDKAAEEGDGEAQFARRLYAYRIKRYIGSYIAVLNGLDALLFTAGVGEHDSSMRALVCDGLSHLGIEIDPVLNGLPATGIRAIHSGARPVKILVIPTNEELEIARQCIAIPA